MKKILILASTFVALLFSAGVATFATAEETDNVETAVVTGSLIKRSVDNASTHVLTLDAEAIDALGQLVLADVLRSSPFNTYGSFNERSGSSAQSNSTINLRGLGDARTLVLVNSKRIPGSPNLGAASVNINMLPQIAIARTELLADGASTVYGSDAIAGVVNNITYEEYEGLTLSISGADRDRDESGESGFGFITGLSTDKAKLVVALEVNERDPIFDADRPYTSAQVRDTNGDGIFSFGETLGVSTFGKNVQLSQSGVQRKHTAYTVGLDNTLDADDIGTCLETSYRVMEGGNPVNLDDGTPDCGTFSYNRLQAATDCPATEAALGADSFGLFPNISGGVEVSQICGFAYANVSANKAGLERENVYISLLYDLNDNLEFYSRVLNSRVESFGRFAPPAAFWPNYDPAHAANPFNVASTGYSVAELVAAGTIHPDPDQLSWAGRYRWTAIGNRDNTVTDHQFDITSGIRGEISEDVTFDAFWQTSRYDSKEFGTYYLNNLGLAQVTSGSGNTDPFDPSNAGTTRATTSQNNSTEYTAFGVDVQFKLPALSDNVDNMYAVVGYIETETDYVNQYDAASEAGLIGGSSGNSSSGSREHSAFYGEVVIPLLPGLEFDVSARSVDYSDFGSETVATFGGSYKWAGFTFRARVNQGFRAPALSDLYGPSTFSAEFANDYVGCLAAHVAGDGNTAANFDASTCSANGFNTQYNTYITTNPDLKAETSEGTTFAVRYDWAGEGLVSDFSVEWNYYSIEIEDQITTWSTQALIYGEQAGVEYASCLAPADQSDQRAVNNFVGTCVSRGTAAGSIPVFFTQAINGGGTSIEGFDIDARVNFDFRSAGQLGLNMLITTIDSYKQRIYPGSALQETNGFDYQPESRYQFSVNYRVGQHRIDVIQNHIGEHAHGSSVNAEGVISAFDTNFDEYTTLDAFYSFDASNVGGSNYGRIKVGVRNLTDEDPILSANGDFTRDSYDLYDPTGSTLFFDYEITF